MTSATTDRQATSGIEAPRAALRALEGIYRAPGVHWVGNGFRVAGFFSAIPDAARKLSPFLLLDYHPTYDYAPTDEPRGVGVHPHRGFETVTLAWEGSVAHHDSAGGGGVIGPGDVQWMTAASGVLHKEYHEASYARRGGPFHMAQLWVNLPKADKMSPPRYQGITRDQIGAVTLPEGAGSVRVIAGEYEGVRGPAKTFTKIDLFDVRLSARGKVEFDFPAHHNLGVVVMTGDVVLNGTEAASSPELAVFDNSGERVVVEAESDAHLLVLSGEPIDEPIVQYGPFVMNTPQEIHEAFADLRRGAFGYLSD